MLVIYFYLFELSLFAQNNDLDEELFKSHSAQEIQNFLNEEFSEKKINYFISELLNNVNIFYSFLSINEKSFTFELGVPKMEDGKLPRFLPYIDFILSINEIPLRNTIDLKNIQDLINSSNKIYKILSYRYTGNQEKDCIIYYLIPKVNINTINELENFGIIITETNQENSRKALNDLRYLSLSKYDKIKIKYYTPDSFLENIKESLNKKYLSESKKIVKFLEKWYPLSNQTKGALSIIERFEVDANRKQEEIRKTIEEREFALKKEQLQKQIESENAKIKAESEQKQRESEKKRKITDTLIQASEEFLKLGNLDEAEKKIKEAESINPEDSLILTIKESIIEKRLEKQLEEEKAKNKAKTEKAKAEAELRAKELENKKQIAEDLLQSVEELIGVGSLDEAEKRLTEAQSIYPNLLQLMTFRESIRQKRMEIKLEQEQEKIRLDAEKKKIEEQVKQSEIERKKRLSETLISTAEELVGAGNFDEAEKNVIEAEKLNPEDPLLLVIKETITEEKTKQAQNVDKEKAERYVLAGNFYLERKNYFGAVKKYREALELDAKNENAMKQLEIARTEYLASEKADLSKGLIVFPLNFKNEEIFKVKDLNEIVGKTTVLDLLVLQAPEAGKAVFQNIEGETEMTFIGEVINEKFKDFIFQEKKGYKILCRLEKIMSHAETGMKKQAIKILIEFVE